MPHSPGSRCASTLVYSSTSTVVCPSLKNSEHTSILRARCVHSSDLVSAMLISCAYPSARSFQSSPPPANSCVNAQVRIDCFPLRPLTRPCSRYYSIRHLMWRRSLGASCLLLLATLDKLTISSSPPPFLLPFYQLHSQPLFIRAHHRVSSFQITTYEFSPHPQRSTDSAMPSSRLAGTSHVELSPSVHSSPALTVSALQIVPAPFPPLVCNTLPVHFRSLERLIRHRLSPAGQFPQLRARTPA